MKLAEGIRRHGFRKWYERQLLSSHAHLILTFFCMIGVYAAIDGARRVATWLERVGDGLTVLLCVGAGLWALRRYLYLLNSAEMAARQADCPSCKDYGRLELLQSDSSGDSVQVRCKGCSHVWRIDA